MTRVLLVTCGGEVRSVTASGHAAWSVKGSDIVCAGVSALLGTALSLLENTEGIKVTADTSLRGSLEFSLEVVLKEDGEKRKLLSERLKCTADFIRHGITSIAREYPSNVDFQEKVNG
ncbi:MAG: ribosomal-processing cysteine protease Prp [Treponema sp.]|nr:ribosomal-processing cysteine protease Prp [Treponema sp.]